MNAAADQDREKRFDWPLCHEAETLLLEQLGRVTARNAFARTIESRMRAETGERSVRPGSLLMDS